MASDPYHSFAADLRSSLSSAQQLAQRYDELARRPSGDRRALDDTLERLTDAVEALESDLGDVRESVEMVESRGPERFGVQAGELVRRKAFVRECEQALATLSAKCRQGRDGRRGRIRDPTGVRGDEEQGYGGAGDEDDEDATLAFEMEQQQQLMARQDTALDMIGSTLTSLRRQAGTLGQEIGEQVDLIGALDSEVDASQSKLTRALGRMDELARRADDRMGGWCVWILIIVLMIFALIAILI